MNLKPTPNPKKASPFTRWTAKTLDNLIKIPGTEKRIGLDPLLGLIPGVGDLLSSFMGLVLLVSGAKKKIPKSAYLRMIANWALNGLVGLIPVLGDLFSFYFKSNQRNLVILENYLNDSTRPRAHHQGWGSVFILIALFTLILAVLALLLGISLWVILSLFKT